MNAALIGLCSSENKEKNVDFGDSKLYSADRLERETIFYDDFESGSRVENEPGESKFVACDVDNVIEWNCGGGTSSLLEITTQTKDNIAGEHEIQRFVLVLEIKQRDLIQLDNSTRQPLR